MKNPAHDRNKSILKSLRISTKSTKNSFIPKIAIHFAPKR